MAKYIDADLLRKEIERLKDEYTDIAIDSQRGWVNANSVIDDLEQLQLQIDSLQQKQPEIPNDLEEAAEKHLDTVFGKGKHQPFYKVLFVAGGIWQKEQMLKEAVEGEVENASLGIVYLRKNLVNEGYSTGDKVRIIIVKEDEK